MQIKEYCEKSSRTMAELNNLHLNTYHMLFGMSTEIGELIDVFKKDLAYNKVIDWTNVQEEIGDLLFYIANFCNINHFDLEDILENNVKKLQTRYPEKFTEENAKNRDTDAERKILQELGY